MDSGNTFPKRGKSYYVYYEVDEIMHVVIIQRIVYKKRDPQNLLP